MKFNKKIILDPGKSTLSFGKHHKESYHDIALRIKKSAEELSKDPVDKMNAFIAAMQAFGISAQEAHKAVKDFNRALVSLDEVIKESNKKQQTPRQAAVDEKPIASRRKTASSDNKKQGAGKLDLDKLDDFDAGEKIRESHRNAVTGVPSMIKYSRSSDGEFVLRMKPYENKSLEQIKNSGNEGIKFLISLQDHSQCPNELEVAVRKCLLAGKKPDTRKRKIRRFI